MEEAQNHELELERINNKNNTYATSKSVSQNLINTAAILLLINTLITVVNNSNLNGNAIALIVFIGLSICVQIVMFILLVILAKSSEEQIGKFTATGINVMVTVLSGILPIISGTIAILNRFI